MLIPWQVYVWLTISSAAVAYDTLYIHLRPLTFRYNIYEWKFEPYQLYQFFDTLKIDMDDRFLLIQSWLNVVEVGMLIFLVMLSLLPWRKGKIWAGLGILVVQAFVFWKTVMYLWYDRRFITVSVQRLYSIAVVFYYFTIGPFIIFPLWTIYSISKNIVRQTQAIQPASSKQKPKTAKPVQPTTSSAPKRRK